VTAGRGDRQSKFVLWYSMRWSEFEMANACRNRRNLLYMSGDSSSVGDILGLHVDLDAICSVELIIVFLENLVLTNF